MLNITDNKVEDILNEGNYYSLKTLKTPDLGRKLAKTLLVIIGVSFLTLFLPWQQNIHGTGKVTTLNPENRPQTVESAIAGRIKDWKIREGEFVNKGDTILSLSEIKAKYFDPNLLLRIKQQIEAKKSSITAKEEKRNALEAQIIALKDAQRIKLNQARNKRIQAKLKLQSDSISFESEKIQYQNTENLYIRNKKRFAAGNIPLTKVQEIESKFQESKAKLLAEENKYLQSQAELINTTIDISGLRAEYTDKISKAQSDLGATIADIYDAEGSLAKIQNEYANMEIRNEQYQVVAPQTGYVVKVLKAGIGETIKEGEAVATIMPETHDKAAEMYIKAMDLPFISEGRKVRIEFDGWPSLQFSGWPNVSVGTFGGIVQVIDRVESKSGMFRILVKPDPDDEEWPDGVRMGSGVKGWVMLDNVPIWYELWRQINGFPPALYDNGEIENVEQKK